MLYVDKTRDECLGRLTEFSTSMYVVTCTDQNSGKEESQRPKIVALVLFGYFKAPSRATARRPWYMCFTMSTQRILIEGGS